MKNDVLDLCLTPQESRMVHGLPPSARDIAVNKRQASDILNNMLQSETRITNEDGSVAVVTYGEKLMAARLNYMMEHPEEWKLTELTQASSGNKQQIEVAKISNADFFSCIDNTEVVEAESDDTQAK